MVADAGPDGASNCTGAHPAYVASVAPIMQGCSGGEICHFFGDAQSLYGQLVNVRSVRDGCDAGLLVAPGDPVHSYLINKLTGVGMCPSTQRMPLGGALTDTQIQTIVDWICAGAQND
jgi:hypothetical protein